MKALALLITLSACSFSPEAQESPTASEAALVRPPWSEEPSHVEPLYAWAVGDSLTFGWGLPPEDSWPSQAALAMPGITWWNFGEPGATVWSLDARAPHVEDFGAASDGSRFSRRHIFFMAGTNDLLQGYRAFDVLDFIRAYVAHRQQAHPDALVYVIVPPPSPLFSQENWTELRDTIMKMPGSLDPGWTWGDWTILQPDKVHLTKAGEAMVADVVIAHALD